MTKIAIVAAAVAQSLLGVVGGLFVRHMVETDRATVLSATVTRAVDAAGRATAPTKVISSRDKILVSVTTRGDVDVHWYKGSKRIEVDNGIRRNSDAVAVATRHRRDRLGKYSVGVYKHGSDITDQSAGSRSRSERGRGAPFSHRRLATPSRRTARVEDE